MPPGLPSSVSVSLQKHHRPELYLIPCIQSMEADSIWHLEPFLGSQSNRIAPIQDFQLLQLCIFTTEVKKKEGEKKATHSPSHSVTHLQHVFIVCRVCRPFTLWPHFFPSAKYIRQITGGNSSQGLMVLTPPCFFPSHFCSLGTLFPPLLCPQPHIHPPPPSPFSHSPSPIPLSQLPVDLAAIQDSADGSVIRSASLHSLFASPLFFLFFFSLFNQITGENFSPFGFEFCRYSLMLAFSSRIILIEKDKMVQNIGSFITIIPCTKSNCIPHCVATSHCGKECELCICKPFPVCFCG